MKCIVECKKNIKNGVICSEAPLFVYFLQHNIMTSLHSEINNQ
jgi:hypothetical protein